MRIILFFYLLSSTWALHAETDCTLEKEFESFRRNITKGIPTIKKSPIKGIKLIKASDVIKFLKTPKKYEFIDVRPISYFKNCHIEGAVSRSFVSPKIQASDDTELDKDYLDSLIKDGKAVVFYCQSEKCYLSVNAVIQACKWGIPKKKIFWFRGGMDTLLRKRKSVISCSDK
jgi:rhodanese-related sulfurtransferase